MRRLRLRGRVDVVPEPAPFAFCYGLLRPRICVSVGLARLLEPAEVEAVLRHERYHLELRDPLKLAVGRSLARALFFLPAVADLLQRYELARELAADRRVAEEMRRTRPIAGALYALLTAPAREGPAASSPSWVTRHAGPVAADGAHPPPGTSPRAPRAAGPSNTDVRIAYLLNDRPPRLRLVSRRAAVLSAVALAGAGAPLLLAPVGSLTAAAAAVHAHLIPGVC